ncbi:unnamed protein product [Vitrella brassicaformis CCMP3155]|uniref:CCHC-type domain-containing protein n=1 Tax=Vitrella brassicaformis (strain CCMP3155) TaxID=1169540 RepID=A0A0G4EPS6_VITBC|nr:unnamed protein product [Vitrella brassicaformis CCMP3155]|eukprot:CEL99566.1 unnamed protein product [Vitrella brassicaformis CCMP3155]
MGTFLVEVVVSDARSTYAKRGRVMREDQGRRRHVKSCPCGLDLSQWVKKDPPSPTASTTTTTTTDTKFDKDKEAYPMLPGTKVDEFMTPPRDKGKWNKPSKAVFEAPTKTATTKTTAKTSTKECGRHHELTKLNLDNNCRHKTIKCFCCGQPGHRWQQCPKLTDAAEAAKNDPRFYIVPAPGAKTAQTAQTMKPNHTTKPKPTTQKAPTKTKTTAKTNKKWMPKNA